MKAQQLLESGKYRHAYNQFIELYSETENSKYLTQALKAASSGDIDDENIVKYLGRCLEQEIDNAEEDLISQFALYFSSRQHYNALEQMLGDEILRLREKVEELNKYDLSALSFLETHYKIKMIRANDQDRVEECADKLISRYGDIKSQNGPLNKLAEIKSLVWQHYYRESDDQEDTLSIAKRKAVAIDEEVLKERIAKLKVCIRFRNDTGKTFEQISPFSRGSDNLNELITLLKGNESDYEGSFLEIAKNCETEDEKFAVLENAIAQKIGVLILPKINWKERGIQNYGKAIGLIDQEGEKKILEPGEVWDAEENNNLFVTFPSDFKREIRNIECPWDNESPEEITLDQIPCFEDITEINDEDLEIENNRVKALEDDVKEAFKTLAGEPLHQEDRSVEIEDLYTTNIKLEEDGDRINTAFMLKGRGLQGIMRPENLGSNGDQVIRLFQSPADLLIVQYVGKIGSLTRKHIKQTAKATDASYYCIVDGTDTARILETSGIKYELKEE